MPALGLEGNGIDPDPASRTTMTDRRERGSSISLMKNLSKPRVSPLAIHCCTAAVTYKQQTSLRTRFRWDDVAVGGCGARACASLIAVISFQYTRTLVDSVQINMRSVLALGIDLSI